MDYKEASELRAKSNLPGKAMATKDSRKVLMTSVLSELNRALENDLRVMVVDQFSGQEIPVLLTISDMCKRLGIKPANFYDLVAEFPELGEAYKEYMISVDNSVRESVTMTAMTGDPQAVGLYHKHYSGAKQQHNKLLEQLVETSLKKLGALTKKETISAKEVKGYLTQTLLHITTIATSQGNLAEATKAITAIGNMLNVSDTTEVSDEMAEMSMEAIVLKLSTTEASAEEIDDETMIEAAKMSPAYANILPRDKEVTASMKALTNAKQKN